MPPDVQWEARFKADSGKQEVRMFVCEIDEQHLVTLNLKMASGRFFSSDPADTNAVILNETAVRALGWKNPEPKLFSYYDQPAGRMRNVIGVIRDYHFQSAREPIKPLAIVMGDTPNWEMAIRVKTSNLDSMKIAVETLWNQYTDQAPFELHVLEQDIKNIYQTERTMNSVIILFTILAIIIACLGLYGLASFTTQKRNKEIGIRKVLGASVTSVAFLLNKQFLAMVLLGNLLAWPVAWWLLQWWLRQFEYHISLGAFYFIVAALITLFIAILSVSYQSLKASLANPVDSLRTE